MKKDLVYISIIFIIVVFFFMRLSKQPVNKNLPLNYEVSVDTNAHKYEANKDEYIKKNEVSVDVGQIAYDTSTAVNSQQNIAGNQTEFLVNSVNSIRDWVRRTCPNRNYLEGLQSVGKRVVVNDNAIIVHLGGDYAVSAYEDICVVVWNNTPNDFDVVIPAFESKEACDYYVKYQWPDSFGVDSVCDCNEGGWCPYLRVKFH